MCLPLSHPLSSPFPFPLCVSCRPSPCVCHHSHVLSCLPSVCVRQGTCTVCVLLATHQHSALLSSFLSCLLFLSLFHHHHPHSWGHQREKKEGKGVDGICGSFSFLFTVSFTPSFLPFQSTMPPHFFALSHSPTPHCTPHHRTHREHHTTTPVCCCVSCLCVAVFVSHCLPADSTLNQTTQRHENRQSPHMGQPMDEAMSE